MFYTVFFLDFVHKVSAPTLNERVSMVKQEMKKV